MKNFIFGLVMLALVASAAAQSGSPTSRALSLQECIQLAIQHNLDVQIERYNPQLALFNLGAARGGYDPSLTFSGQHDHGNSGASVFQGGLPVPGSQTDADSFNAVLGGPNGIERVGIGLRT